MKTLVKTAFLGLALVGLVACGDDGGGGTPAGGNGGGGGDDAAKTDGGDAGGGAKQAYDASKFKGSISGSVKTAEKPQERLLPIGGDAFCTGAWDGKKAVDEDYVVNEDGSVPNAMVWVHKGPHTGFTYSAPTDRGFTVSQTNCYYTPHVFGVMVGEKFTVANDDKTLHNVHAKPKRNTESNQAQNPGAKNDFSFAKKESKISFVCDVHSWMSAWAFAFDHPFFAVTGDDGKFEITGLPPGDYTVRTWTRKLGESEMKVTVGADSAAADVQLKKK